MGIFISQFEQGEISPDLVRKACECRLEGLVSKRRDSAYRLGWWPSWVKVKNRGHSPDMPLNIGIPFRDPCIACGLCQRRNSDLHESELC
jgi:hypothetical protein